jgi:primosomal protein N' (replication factor Y)
MEEKPLKFIVDVVPVAPLSLSRQQYYSYLSDKEVSPGSLVSISFFNRSLEGIVVGNRSDFHHFGNIKLKKINYIIEENFLDQNQLALVNFISEYYFSPLGIVLKFFIPKRVKAREIKSKNKISKAKKIKLTKEQFDAIANITKNNLKLKIKNLPAGPPRRIEASRQGFKFLLYGPASSGKTEVYFESIKKMIGKTGQALILLPEIMLTPQARERYSAYFGEKNIIEINSTVSKGRLYDNWKRIKSGEKCIIIGSRMAIFAPFNNLKIIVVDEEQDMSFKQWDMNPRYDARRVAEKLSEIHQTKLIFGSATPRIEDFYLAQQKKITLLKISALDKKQKNIEIVDMKKERWAKNFSVISKKLSSEIIWNLKNKFQTILFINRQGSSAFSICQSCKEVLKCPKCDRALVYGSEGFYRCLHCNYKTDIFPKCAECGHDQFKNIGAGTEKIETEIKKIAPEAKIKRVDLASTRKTGIFEKIYTDFCEGKIDILIGTQMITKGWDLPNVGLVGIIDADSLLGFPDFSANEKAFQNLVQVSGRTGRSGSRYPGKVILQTYRPETPVIQMAKELNYEKFYASEIDERESLGYPPFVKLIKLIFQDEKSYEVEKSSKKAYNEINDLAMKNKSVKCYPPQDPLVSKIRGRSRKQIIIKFTGLEIPENLSKIIKKLGKGWIIDIDPISLA